MAGRLSLPFGAPNDPGHPKTFRSAKHETLGEGHSLDRVGKKMVWLVYEAHIPPDLGAGGYSPLPGETRLSATAATLPLVVPLSADSV